MTNVQLSATRRAGRIVVGVTGSPSSAAALGRAVQEARRTGRVLVAVLAWEPWGGEVAYQKSAERSLEALWEHKARGRLTAAFEEVFGGVPGDIEVQTAVVRGPAAEVLSAYADQADDVLVLGAGPRRTVTGLGRGHVRRRAVARSAAPALLVAPPRLRRSARRTLRHLTPDDFAG